MSPGDASLGGLVRDDRAALDRLISELNERFGRVLSLDTVARCVYRCYGSLFRTGRAADHLLACTERLVGSQLSALSRATALVDRQVVPKILLYGTAGSGRAQLAAAWMNQHAQGRVDVGTAGAPPSPAVAPRVLEVLSRMSLPADWDEPEIPTSALLDRSDLVILVDAELEAESSPAQNALYWPPGDPVSQDDYYQILAVSTDLNIEVQRVLNDLRL
jgi:protein-tyrosine-phosphatase